MSRIRKRKDHCLKPLPNIDHESQLTRQQTGQLTDALLYARLNTATPEMGYQALSDELKQHTIGKLIASALFDNEMDALDQAARLLAPNTPNYWVALMRR